MALTCLAEGGSFVLCVSSVKAVLVEERNVFRVTWALDVPCSVLVSAVVADEDVDLETGWSKNDVDAW